MADNEIKTRYTVDDQGTDDLRRIADGQKQVGDSGEQAGKQQGQFEQGLNNVRNVMLGMVGAGGAMALITEAFDALQQRVAAANDELQRNASLAREVVDASIVARFLGNRPEDIARSETAAAAVGRDAQEGSQALARIASARPGLSTEAQFELLQRSLELSRQDPTSPLASFVSPFLAVQNAEPDPIAASNILFESIQQADVTDPNAIAPLFARFLPVGALPNVGLTPAESGGLIAGATASGLEPSEAITALTQVALLLQGEGSPEGRKILDRLGIRGADLLETLPALSQAVQSGEIDGTGLEQIFGAESVRLGAKLIQPATLETVQERVAKVVARSQSDTIRAVERAGNVFDAEPRTAARETERIASAQTDLARSRDEVALNAAAARAVIARELQAARERGDVTPAEVAAIVPEGGGGVFDRLIAEGFSPAEAAVIVERSARTDNFDFGSGVDVDLSSAVLSELGAEAVRSTGASIRPGAISRANRANQLAQFLSATGQFRDRDAPSMQAVAGELGAEAEALGLTINQFNIGQQFNATPEPAATDNGKRSQGVSD